MLYYVDIMIEIIKKRNYLSKIRYKVVKEMFFLNLGCMIY